MSAVMAGCGPSKEDIRAVVNDVMNESIAVQHLTKAETIGPYSPAVVAGRFLFLSGQIGIDPATRALAGDDISSQTVQALENISTILAEAGLDSSSVVQCTVYLTDIRDFQKMNLLYGGYFAEGRYPARTTVQVANLPAGARIEIAAIAYYD